MQVKQELPKVHLYADFCNKQDIKIKYIQPGKPTQNAYIERFNRSYREDILDAYLFESIDQLRELSTDWMNDYNQLHPHQSLNNMSPLKYLEFNQHSNGLLIFIKKLVQSLIQ